MEKERSPYFVAILFHFNKTVSSSRNKMEAWTRLTAVSGVRSVVVCMKEKRLAEQDGTAQAAGSPLLFLADDR